MQSLIGMGRSYQNQATAGTRTQSRLQQNREQLGEAMRDKAAAAQKQNRDSMATIGAGMGMKAGGTKAGVALAAKGMSAMGMGATTGTATGVAAGTTTGTAAGAMMG